MHGPRLIYDLGCGPGNSTALLLQQYPDARVVGIGQWLRWRGYRGRTDLRGCGGPPLEHGTQRPVDVGAIGRIEPIDDLRQTPAFTYVEPALGRRVAALSASLAGLAVPATLLFVLAAGAFRRTEA